MNESIASSAGKRKPLLRLSCLRIRVKPGKPYACAIAVAETESAFFTSALASASTAIGSR